MSSSPTYRSPSFGGDPADAFTVVAPSLPGFTFSFESAQRRSGIDGMADVFAALMSDVLGYERFAAQGGDWGGDVVGRLGFAHAEKLHGIHLNFLPVRVDSSSPPSCPMRIVALRPRSRAGRPRSRGNSAIQGTKPQTLAYALTDSPVGRAAWIVEKFRTWTDSDAQLTRGRGPASPRAWALER